MAGSVVKARIEKKKAIETNVGAHIFIYFYLDLGVSVYLCMLFLERLGRRRAPKIKQNGAKTEAKLKAKSMTNEVPEGLGCDLEQHWAAETEKRGCGCSAGRHLGSVLEPKREPRRIKIATKIA